MNTLRGAAVLSVALAFGLAIAASEDSLALGIGLSPLIWIALEGAWRLLSVPARSSQAESRTGMRREPKGLPNFW